MEAVPTFNSGVNAGSHAHPLPVRPSPQALKEQRIRAFVARQRVLVKLNGLPCERSPTVTDVLTPKIRRSPFDQPVNPRHLDLTECWKGLSHSQAKELTMWYHFFHQCLHDEVRTSLFDSLIENLLQSEESVDEAYLLPRMLESLRSKPHRVLGISVVDLIDNMMGMFHERFPIDAASYSSWTHFSGGLSVFLHNFLRMQDCFCDSPTGLCVMVQFDFQYAESLLTATGEVAWQIPGVRILRLPDSLSSGEEYRITPFALGDVLAFVRSTGPTPYADNVTYTITQSPLDFAWNERKRCFKAIAPDYGDNETHTAETTLNATITTRFPGGVKFERQSRWFIKVSISPAESKAEPWAATMNLDGGCSHDTPEYTLRGPQYTGIRDSSNSIRSVQQARADPTTPSPSKRKVSTPEIAETCDAKRRRRGLDSESVDPQFGGDMIWDSPSPLPHNKTGTDNVTNVDADFIPSGWDYSPRQGDSGFSSPDMPQADSDSSVPDTADTDEDYVQQQIMRNYKEFADRRLHKDAGLVVSPVSDGERRVFEGIFLGSEVGSLVDESFDAVMGEG